MLNQISINFEKITGKLDSWVDQVILMLPNFVVAILIVVAFVLLAKLVRKLASKTLNKFSDNVAINSLLSTIIYVAVVTIGIFVALGVLELDKTVTSLLAGVGVVGLALGFAFQNTAANFISGIFMAAKHPINVGDIVETNDYFGTVQTIDLRFTEVRTPQGQAVIIPNRTIIENPLVNYSITGERRVDLKCGISYGEDLQQVKQVAVKSIEDIDFNKDKPVEFLYTEFGDSSINFVMRFWISLTAQKDFLLTQSEAIMALKKAFDQNDIMIPFPIRTLDFGIKGGVKLDEMIPEQGSLKNQN